MESTRRHGPDGHVIAARRQVSTRLATWRAPLAILMLLAWPAVRAVAQSVSLSVKDDAVFVRAPGFGFIKGEPLVRLKDGRSVRVDLGLDVLPKPGATAVAQRRQIFVLSYDLWEERFSVTQAGAPRRSISHLTVNGAEAWCIEQLSISVSALGSLGRDLPFWIRLESRILDGDGAASSDDGEGFTLRWLIDSLSRRRKASELTHSIEAGPLRLPR